MNIIWTKLMKIHVPSKLIMWWPEYDTYIPFLPKWPWFSSSQPSQRPSRCSHSPSQPLLHSSRSLLLSYSSSSSLQTQGTIEHIEWVNIFVESDVGLGEVQGERATWTSQGLCFRHVLPPVPIKMVRNLRVTTWHASYRLLGDSAVGCHVFYPRFSRNLKGKNK